MKKEIQIKSKKRILKNYIYSSIFFRILKLILNPFKLFIKLKNYQNDKNSIVRIDWKKRTKEILKEWSNRNDIFYLNLFKKLNLKKVDEYKYLHNFTSIYVGKK